MRFDEIKTSIRKPIEILLIVLAVIAVTALVIAFHNSSKIPSEKSAADQTPPPAVAATSSIGTLPTKTIYLTLDMDMNERMYWLYITKKETLWYDPALFVYLEQNNIPTTFFVSGLFAETYPDLMKDLALDQNFSFQNHSYDESSFVPHCYWLQTLKTDQQKINQIDATENAIKDTTGQTPTYFRFPGLCENSANEAFVRNLGFAINEATIVAGDPFNNNTGAMVNAVMSNARNNGVIIMHIGGPNAPKSLAVLEQIIPKLKAEGYAFAKL